MVDIKGNIPLISRFHLDLLRYGILLKWFPYLQFFLVSASLHICIRDLSLTERFLELIIS